MYTCPMGMLFYDIKQYDTLWLLAQKYNTTVYSITELNPGLDPYHLNVGQTIAICPGYGNYQEYNRGQVNCISRNDMLLSNEARKLWEQHSVWTRIAIMSIVWNLPDKDLVIERLLRNPTDFETMLKPFYGDKIASKFSQLLKDHLVIAGQLVTASKAGNQKEASDIEKKWYKNADEIAVLLGAMNPYWSEEEWKAMLHEHLGLVKTEAVNLITKDYAKGIDIYDKIENQALEMADVMARGIIKQFPDKFKM